MKNNRWFAPIVLFALIILTACSSGSRPPAPTVVRITSAPAATQAWTLPDPMPMGRQITHKELKVTLNRVEVSDGYETEFGSRRDPARGFKFVWTEIQIENISAKTLKIPETVHFSLVIGTDEFKTSYGHRAGFQDYTNLKPELYPGQQVTAWLRFDIPLAAQLENLQFVFLPESMQVSFSNPSGYAWADHPEYFWMCSPEK